MTKLLLDESIPRRLSASFPSDFDVITVQQMGWSGTKNGALLQIASEREFEALITADRGIEYQQNLSTLAIPVVILAAYRTRVPDLVPLVPKVISLIEAGLRRQVYVVQ